MADEYRLRLEGEYWSIIDEATHEPARLDGIPLSSMAADEAKYMLKILKGLERVRKASKRSAKLAKRSRTKATEASPSAMLNDVFAPLRPLIVN